MEILLIAVLAGLTVALLKIVKHYSSWNKYPSAPNYTQPLPRYPLPSIVSDPSLAIFESAVFTQPGHTSLDSSPTGHQGTAQCDGGSHGSYDGGGYCGDGGASGHH
jgi:hypothetical protein